MKVKNKFILLLVLFVYPVQIHAQNLIHNGDFEGHNYTMENLWDGVDNTGRLRVIGCSAPDVGDINGDGKKDIICGDEKWMMWYYLNSGTNQAPEFTTGKFIKARFDSNVKPVLVDWNGDRAKDIIFGSREGWVCFLRGKSATVVFGEPRFVELGREKLDIGQFSAPAVADWNGDGKIDLILGEGTYSANSVYIYLNKGSSSSPKFDKKERLYLAYGEGKMNLTPSIVDWDKDGDLDLVVGDEYGYINLYINEAGRRKVKTLKYAGRLKNKYGQDIDVGSMSTPCATDWDEDGDWDIICGSSYGNIRLILNEGSLGNPEFAEPVALRGENALKGVGTYGWSSDTNRTGAYSLSIDDKAPHSGAHCLKVICHERYGGDVVVSGSMRSSLERDLKYRVNFFVKGERFKGSWGIRFPQVTEKRVVEGVRKHIVLEQAWGESGDFSAGSSWKKVSGTFKLPKIPKSKDKNIERKVGKKKWCTFDLALSGDGTLWIDSVSLEED